jgi:hypothetical protein
MLQQKFSNLSKSWVKVFIDLCAFSLKRNKPSIPEGITPILSKAFNERGQVDLIDMQANEYNGMRWLLHYQRYFSCKELREYYNQIMAASCFDFPVLAMKIFEKNLLPRLFDT